VLLPILFVLIWTTGFLTARFVAPHADPLTFLAIRVAASAIAFAVLSTLTGAVWPRTLRGWFNAAVTGVLMQAIYLGGVFWAVRHGLPAGTAALITGLQPLLTAALAFPLLGERVPPRRWAGIILGFLGAVLVLAPQLRGAPVLVPAVVCVGSMFAITFGTLWQKHTGAGDLRTTACIQFLGAAALMIPAALLLETGRFDGSWQAWSGLVWAVLGLSVGATWLLLTLIRRGAVAGVTSLFYLVPPVAALTAWLLFGETLVPVQMAGMALAAAGVGLAARA